MVVIKAILLERKPLREFDEQLLFLSPNGLVKLLSFGSRSPRSSRGKCLSQLAWLELEVHPLKQGKKNSGWVLKAIPQISPIISLEKFSKQDLNFYMPFNALVKELMILFPHKNEFKELELEELTELEKNKTNEPNVSSPEQALYQLLQYLSSSSLQTLNIEKTKVQLLFDLALLNEFGVLGRFTGCQETTHVPPLSSAISPTPNKELVEYYFYEGMYYCKQCVSLNQLNRTVNIKNITKSNRGHKGYKSFQKVPFKIPLRSLLLLNFFLDKYQLSENFFYHFGLFLVNKVKQEEVEALLKVTQEIKEIAKR